MLLSLPEVYYIFIFHFICYVTILKMLFFLFIVLYGELPMKIIFHIHHPRFADKAVQWLGEPAAAAKVPGSNHG